MSLVTPPSFRSPLPLSARFHYAPKGTNVHTMTFGTTGSEFIKRAWWALQRTSFSDLPFGNNTAYSPSWTVDSRTFNTERGSASMPRGTRWDNDFNRALWAWTYKQWESYERRIHGTGSGGVYSTYMSLRGRPSTEWGDFAGWLNALSKIELSETSQTVTAEAMLVAEILVADSFGLVDNVSSPRVSMDHGTVFLPYNTDPPLPTIADTSGGHQYKVWARSESQQQGTYLSDDPPAPPPAPPVTPEGSGPPGGGGGPLTPPGGLSDAAKTGIVLAAAAGGILLVSGLGIWLTFPEDGAF